MTLPVIGIAASAFGERPDLVRDFADRAEIRFVDVGGGPRTTESTEGVDAVVVTLQRLSGEVIDCLGGSVRVIGRAGVGLDTIDLGRAAARGIAVVNEPAYGAPEVASHALAMLLALHRRLAPSDRFVRDGWSGGWDMSGVTPLDEARVAVVGGGRIGRAFVEVVTPLVGQVAVYDPAPVSVPDGAIRSPDLDDALRGSDAVSLHLPLAEVTRNLIGARELALLRRGAVVVNVARGGIVDEQALVDALHDGQIGGAGLDVFAEEPLPSSSPLLSAPNTVLTPHCAASSDRSAYRLSHWTITDCIEYVARGAVTHGSVVVEPASASPGVLAKGA